MVSRLSKTQSSLFIAVFIFLAVLTGCGNFSLYDQLGMDFLGSGGFMLIPESPTLAVNKTLLFSVTGGTPPFEYEIVNPVDGSGIIEPDTGLYTAPSAAPHTDVVQVRDNGGLVRSVSIFVVNEVDLQIFPPSLTISTNDIFHFSTIGGNPPYTYEVTSGGGTINLGTGEFHSPSTAGPTNIRVTDDSGTEADSTVTTRTGLVIVPYTASVPANNNIAYSTSGGVPPFTFSMESGSGTVTPAGLYTASGSSGTDKVRVTDDDGYSSIATISVTPAQPLNIVPSSVFVPTGGSFSFSATGGTLPYSFTIVSGSGSTTGSGVYSAPGTPGTDVLRVTDSSPGPLTADANVMVISLGTLTVTPPSLTISTNDTYQFTASGGTLPYVYTVTSGGGSINPVTGEFHAPSTAGTTNVRVTDDNGTGTSVNSTVTIREGLVIIPYTASVPANNNITFAASGGAGGYTYAMVSGSGTVTVAGIYTASGSSGTDKVKVTDVAGDVSIATISVTPAQPLNIVPSSVIVLTDGGFNFSATGGKPPYTFTILSGGGSITGSGIYTAPGTPGKAYIRVTDSSPVSLTSNGEVIIVDFGPLAITPGTVTVEQGKSYTFTASGGIPQYVYSVPPPGSGIIIGSTGVYTAPMALGTEIVRVTDSDNDTFDATVNIAPAAPTKLDATAASPNTIELTWEDNATGEDGFSIEMMPDGDVYGIIVPPTITVPAFTPPNIYSCIVSGLSNNERYFFRVRAVKGAVYSGYSNEISERP